jgi:hypothetical protein
MPNITMHAEQTVCDLQPVATFSVHVMDGFRPVEERR